MRENDLQENLTIFLFAETLSVSGCNKPFLVITIGIIKICNFARPDRMINIIYIETMKPLKPYDIKLFSLEEGDHRFHYHLDQRFFDQFEYDEFDQADIEVDVVAKKQGNLISFDMQSTGKVVLPDDLTGEPYWQPLKGKMRFILQFGDHFDDENEELIVLPYHTPVFNLAQNIYEMVVLSVPLKHIDPERIVKETQEEESGRERIDPRWEKLNKLLNNDKTE